ncbi:uncharacterized protein ACA1_396900 [Acanthamoeba castellanii str. Neff]|uniref:Uncharacterized protein n=1 Tax=Acanthamoeba castellanii (strain ATCC 30010 / Neff) TaxID=1257118 RepID=L8HBF1_ACACF|nr:uncharacterized protein ACA1_396900 [Acanthamoeba castellanii str. Neff]ELR22864.1 hypothetical protein ACA1_396900 [Acanthamoeba castellanii str. Neff]
MNIGQEKKNVPHAAINGLHPADCYVPRVAVNGHHVRVASNATPVAVLPAQGLPQESGLLRVCRSSDDDDDEETEAHAADAPGTPGRQESGLLRVCRSSDDDDKETEAHAADAPGTPALLRDRRSSDDDDEEAEAHAADAPGTPGQQGPGLLRGRRSPDDDDDDDGKGSKAHAAHETWRACAERCARSRTTSPLHGDCADADWSERRPWPSTAPPTDEPPIKAHASEQGAWRDQHGMGTVAALEVGQSRIGAEAMGESVHLESPPSYWRSTA